MKRLWLGLGLAAAMAGQSPDATQVLGSKHDLSPGGSGPVSSLVADVCVFCHTPHTSLAQVTPLWNHNLSTQTYNTYTSTTYSSGAQTPSTGTSKLCLSCHDGTVAVGQTSAKGLITTTGAMPGSSKLGTNLGVDHPLGMKATDDGQLASALFANPPRTNDPAVKLNAGRIECTTCHDPHRQRLDPVVQSFLVRSNSGGAICLACHDPSRAQPNWLNGWAAGAHSSTTHSVPATASFGPYGSVSANACANCHGSHNDPSASAQRLLRAPEEDACRPCHSGANVSPPAPNIMSDLMTKTYRHPVITVSGRHDAAESVAPVNAARHAECPDCHNSHAAAPSIGSPVPPAVQPALVGASGYNGAGVIRPASNEFEVCYKCHANSIGKAATGYGHVAIRAAGAADRLDVRQMFLGSPRHNVTGALSSAPVPSLRPYMIQIDGRTPIRPLTPSSQLFCSDCHANDQARISGGTGANGPHASNNAHLLERAFDQENPGPITFTAGVNGSAGICNKCHDVDNSILQNRSFQYHNLHVREQGASCSTCHDPHGVAGGNTTNNYALINFDTTIVTLPGGTTQPFVRTATGGTCTLTCHGEPHSAFRYTRP